MDNVNLQCPAYIRMLELWELTDCLLGGTLAMRKAGKKWLPKETAEDDAAYKIRLSRSYLYNAYGNTLEKLVAKPFSKPITLQGQLPEPLQKINSNLDLAGSNVTQFGRDVFKTLIDKGVAHILVDYSNVPKDINKAQEQTLNARPIFVHIHPEQLIGWDTEITSSGEERLTRIRYREYHTEKKGTYDVKEVLYIRVFTETGWELWKQDDKDSANYHIIDSGEHTFGAVPLFTAYINRLGYFEAKSALEDLAWLNLAHYQSESDQRNILRVSRVGILFGKGFAEDEYKDGFVVGPNQSIKSANPEAELSYVEHSGQAIGAGRQDLIDLEDRMEILGLQPLIAKTARTTATGKVLDEARTQSSIMSWIRELESLLEQAYSAAATYFNVTLPKDFKVDVFSDFSVSVKATEDATILLQARVAKEISHETYLREMKRRGLLGDDIDVKTEIANYEDIEEPDEEIVIDDDEY